MQFLKLFTQDNERVSGPGLLLGAEYLEGRGLYPERRDSISGGHENDAQYPDTQYPGSQYPGPQYEREQPNHYTALAGGHNDGLDSHRQVIRRRMPLTTLEALVQIRENRLNFESGQEPVR